MRHPAMLRWPEIFLFGGAILVVATCCVATNSLFAGDDVPAALAPAAKTPTADDIAGWVRELDSEEYSVREAATARLQAAGVVAFEPLTRALVSPSAEVAERANLILHRIASHSDESALNKLTAAIQKLGSKRASVARIAAEFKSQQQKYKHQRAISRIRALGGGLSGNWEGEALADVGIPIMPVMMPPPVMVFDDDAVVPAIALEAAARDIELTIEEPRGVEPPPARGIVGLLARLIAPVAEPRIAPPREAIREEIADATSIPPEAIPIPVAPPAPLVPLFPEPAPARAPVEAVPLADVPVDAIPRFAPAELPAVIEPPASLEKVEFVPDAILIAPAMGFALPVEMGMTGEDGDAYAELRLDAAFRGSDADLAVLKEIPEIYSLSISGAKLTDAALPHIAVLPRLTTLNVQQTAFSSQALRKLRQQRPELSVICRGSAMLGINAGLEGSCIITSVFRTSGAYEAGLRDGDEILAVGGEKIRDFSDLTIAVYPHQPGDKISVTFRRNDGEKTVDVLLKPRATVEE